jgi:mannose-6-phosphate isomerase|tara:strand:+ start:397 stop:744 length:348 start_codon:yes stop_codon:yes gene_type:complete
MANYKETRPWGTFENLLDTDYCKVKKIIIKPGQAPSYQYHFKRSEVWVVVQGEGELTLNGETEQVTIGQVIYVPVEAKHQIKNNTDENLIFIEIQQGSYFGEDDIVRLNDQYGRV